MVKDRSWLRITNSALKSEDQCGRPGQIEVFYQIVNFSVLKTFNLVKSCPEKQKLLKAVSTEKRSLEMPKVAQKLPSTESGHAYMPAMACSVRLYLMSLGTLFHKATPQLKHIFLPYMYRIFSIRPTACILKLGLVDPAFIYEVEISLIFYIDFSIVSHK